MTEFKREPQKPGETDDEAAEIIVSEALKYLKLVDETISPEVVARLLASYDDHQRKRKNRLSLSLFADAFGLRILARPLAAAGALASLSAAGFVAGAATASSGDAQTYAELASAFDQSYVVNEENGLWAEE